MAEKEAALATMLELCGDRVIFTVDGRERIDQWGPGAEAKLGWSARDIRGGAPGLVLVSAPAADGGAGRFELRHRDGQTLWFTGSVKPLSPQSPARIYILDAEG
jgi:PAS domain-containing protein